jgi:hypothetical protein
MTNLLISFPGVFEAANYLECTSAPAEFTSIHNITRGARSSTFEAASATTSVTFTADLLDGNTQAIDHVIIAKAHLLFKSALVDTISFRGADDESGLSSSGNDIFTPSDFSNTSLTGPSAQDIILEDYGNASAAKRWFALIMSATGSDRFRFSKCYAGQFFDFGSEPVNYECAKENQAQFFYADDGTAYSEDRKDSLFKGFFEWGGVSDAKAEEFFELCNEHLNHGVFFYARDYTKVLAGERLLHCSISRPRVNKIWSGFNSVRIDFQEFG